MIYKSKSPKSILPIFGRRMLVALLILFQLSVLLILIWRVHQLYWVSLILTLLSGITAFHLLVRHDKSAFKLSLIFLILFFPVFGGVFYWVFHFQTSSSGFRRTLDRLIARFKESYTPDAASLSRAASEHPRDAKLLHYLQHTCAFPTYTDTNVRYLPSGRDMLDTLLKDLRAAEKTIFLEYFIIAEGVMWDAILSILSEKAANGVDVRVIYDDIGSIRTLPAGYAKKLSQMGIKCRVFNPFHPFLTSTQNNRNHRKIAVIDNRVAYTGGINLADEYIGEKLRFGVWKDNAVRLEGAAASSFGVMFLQMWGLLTANAEIPRLESLPSQAGGNGWVQPYNDSPMDKENVSERVYLHAIERAQRTLYITTPYLMVGEEVLSAIKYAANSGVDVRIITPGIPDKKAVHFTTRSYYRELVGAGVGIYEFSEGFVHAKTVISDGDLATVGTVNMDFRSLYLHFECGTVLYGTEAVRAIEADFLETLTHCRRITAADCKHNILVRIWQAVCRIFAPLM